MKFHNPETWEVFDNIVAALDRFCRDNDCFWWKCKMENSTNGEPCGEYVKSHPCEAARLMGYVEENKEENMVKELYRLALSTYGAQAQTMMVMEEMAELQKELCKHARGKENRAQIAEEIADVQIMLEQMELLHDCAGLVAGFKAQKLDRLEKRLREG